MNDYEDKPADPARATCPNCKRVFAYDHAAEPAWMPFCCERCQWMDLGRWLQGEYFISRSLQRDDTEQDD